MEGTGSSLVVDSAQNLAGKSIFLEIGAKLDVIDVLLQGKSLSIDSVVERSGANKYFVKSYMEALCKLDLTIKEDEEVYLATENLSPTINNCGYLLWALQSCAPLIQNPISFSNDLHGSIDAYPRDGEHVARTSKWMGATDFYPHAEHEILKDNPAKIVDFGSGTCGLLIRLLEQLPKTTAIGVDVSASACREARKIVHGRGFSNRIRVENASVESLIKDPSPLKGADVIHAGFVFHDLNPTESNILPQLLSTIKRTSPSAKLVIADAIPDDTPWENNAYSLAFTFLHTHFMDRKFPSETGWCRLLEEAGFTNVSVDRPGLSGSRLIVGH